MMQVRNIPDSPVQRLVDHWIISYSTSASREVLEYLIMCAENVGLSEMRGRLLRKVALTCLLLGT